MSKAKPKDLITPVLNESAFVWDDSMQMFITAYERQYKRVQAFNFLNSVIFNSSAEVFTSNSFECPAYSKGLLLLNIDFTASPTDIYFKLQFSNDGQSFYSLSHGFYSDLRYALAQGDLTECLEFNIIANYFRVYAVSSGCDTSNYITVSADVIFSS